MPFYQFTIVEGSLDAATKARVAKAITAAHVASTGAPGHLVTCSFVEVAADSFFEGGEPTTNVRMVGTIRRRPDASKQALLLALSQAWSEATGQPVGDVVMFLVDIPGFQAFEQGALLSDAPEYVAALVQH